MDPGNPANEPPPSDTSRRTRSPWRAIFLGCFLLVPNAFWLAHMEMGTRAANRFGAMGGPFPTTYSLFANAISVLVALIVANGFLKKWRAQYALTQPELLLVYIMITIGSCLTSVDFLDVLMPMLAHPTRYATEANGWKTLFMQYIPGWFGVTDLDAAMGWYKGNSNPYTWEHLRAWAVPLATWGAFILVLLGSMLCMNLVVRKQWTQNEKLSYPIIQLPLEMSDENVPFFRSRLLWTGFSLAGGICILNGIAMLVPQVPALPIKIPDISPYFPTPPWNAMGWTSITFYPFAIGLGFLLPTDLLFSSWFFYLFWKAERILSALYGLNEYSPQYPYVNEQSFGGYVGIALMTVVVMRRYLARFVQDAWRGRVETGESLALNRAAVIGSVLGPVLLAGFFHHAGLPLWMSVVAILIYFSTAIACTRMRAELGPPSHDLHNGGPDYILASVLGTRGVPAQHLTVLTYFYWFNRAYRSLAMPCQLEALKMGERRNIPIGWIVLALMLATVVGTFSGYWALYHFGYTRGTEAKMAPHLVYFGWEAFNRLQSWTQSPREMDVPALLAAGLGLATTLLLQVIRMRFTGWPFHPLGLAVSGSWTMNTIWLPMLIAWAVKASLLRYGGLRSYRTALYFFMGLILGDYLPGCLWPIVGWIVGANAYSFQQ